MLPRLRFLPLASPLTLLWLTVLPFEKSEGPRDGPASSSSEAGLEVAAGSPEVV